MTRKSMIMRGITLTVLAAIAICLCPTEASAGKKTVPIGGKLTQIANYTAADIYFTHGPNSVEVIGPDNVLDRMHVSVSNGCLKVSYDGNGYQGNVFSDVVINVSGMDVGSITNSGAGDIKVDRLEAENVSLQVSGAGDITVGEILSTSLQVSVFGAGDIDVSRSESSTVKAFIQGAGDLTVRRVKAVSIEAIVQGAGDISMQSVEAASVRATCQGAGDIDMRSVKAASLRATCQGAGDTTVGGDVSTAVLMCQGAGNINAKGLKAVKITKIQQGAGEIND